ncbi:hypothetical protein [Sporichthya brevicatena]|uniref:hypothetical protein n=1 Tax=Sporichthya brevicatena TaxID=171442 RepID=UPI0031E1AFD6
MSCRQNRRRAQRAGAVVALGALAVPVVVLSTDVARADSMPSFDSVASAYGVQVTATNQGIPLGLTLEGSGPTTSVRLTDVGVSSGFASFPFPGTTVAGLPGIAGALVGFPTPEYPLIAASDLGSEPQEVNFPGVSLKSTSGAHQVDASAVVGQPAAGATSVSNVEQRSDGSVVSRARSTIDALNIGGTLTLRGVESLATVEADGTTGELQRRASLSIARLSIPGTNITLPKTTPESIPLPNPVPGLPQAPPVALPPIPVPFGGQTVPATDIGFRDGNFSITLPTPDGKEEAYTLPAQVVIDALKQAGLAVTFQAAEETATGITAPVLTFAYTTADIPANPSGFTGPVPITYLLGRSIANVTLSPVWASDSGLTAGGSAAPGTAGGHDAPLLPGTAPGPDLAGVPGAVPVAGLGSGVSPATVPVVGDVLTLAGLTRGDAGLAYVALVVVALVGGGAALSLRLLRVRSLWSS